MKIMVLLRIAAFFLLCEAVGTSASSGYKSTGQHLAPEGRTTTTRDKASWNPPEGITLSLAKATWRRLVRREMAQKNHARSDLPSASLLANGSKETLIETMEHEEATAPSSSSATSGGNLAWMQMAPDYKGSISYPSPNVLQVDSSYDMYGFTDFVNKVFDGDFSIVIGMDKAEFGMMDVYSKNGASLSDFSKGQSKPAGPQWSYEPPRESNKVGYFKDLATFNSYRGIAGYLPNAADAQWGGRFMPKTDQNQGKNQPFYMKLTRSGQIFKGSYSSSANGPFVSKGAYSGIELDSKYANTASIPTNEQVVIGLSFYEASNNNMPMRVTITDLTGAAPTRRRRTGAAPTRRRRTAQGQSICDRNPQKKWEFADKFQGQCNGGAPKCWIGDGNSKMDNNDPVCQTLRADDPTKNECHLAEGLSVNGKLGNAAFRELCDQNLDCIGIQLRNNKADDYSRIFFKTNAAKRAFKNSKQGGLDWRCSTGTENKILNGGDGDNTIRCFRCNRAQAPTPAPQAPTPAPQDDPCGGRGPVLSTDASWCDCGQGANDCRQDSKQACEQQGSTGTWNTKPCQQLMAHSAQFASHFAPTCCTKQAASDPCGINGPVLSDSVTWCDCGVGASDCRQTSEQSCTTEGSTGVWKNFPCRHVMQGKEGSTWATAFGKSCCTKLRDSQDDDPTDDAECDDKIPGWASIDGKRFLTAGETYKVSKAKSEYPTAKEEEILKKAGVGSPAINFIASTEMDKDGGPGPPIYVGSYKNGNCAGKSLVFVKTNFALGACTAAGASGWHCWECVDGRVLFGVFDKDPLKNGDVKGKANKYRIDWVDAKAQVRLNPDGNHCGSECQVLNNESFRFAWHSSNKNDLCKAGRKVGATSHDKKTNWPLWLQLVVCLTIGCLAVGCIVSVCSGGDPQTKSFRKDETPPQYPPNVQSAAEEGAKAAAVEEEGEAAGEEDAPKAEENGEEAKAEEAKAEENQADGTPKPEADANVDAKAADAAPTEPPA